MIFYVTKPDNHELVMGGWRSVKLWTDKPAFQHFPVGGHSPISSKPEDQDKTYQDVGWTVNGYGRGSYSARIKPIIKQDAQLEQIIWDNLCWSACPKGISMADSLTWTQQESETPGRTNWESLLWHVGKESDIKSNIHHKRFLLEVNIRTNECKIIKPTVYTYQMNSWLDHDTIEETHEISDDLANRTYYACPSQDIPF